MELLRSAMSTFSQDTENDKSLPEWLTKIISRSSSRHNRVNPTPRSDVSVTQSLKTKDAAQHWLPVPPERTPSRERRQRPRGENAQQIFQSSQVETLVSKMHPETKGLRYCELPPLDQPVDSPNCPPAPQPHTLPPSRGSQDLVQNFAFVTATPSAYQGRPQALNNTPVEWRMPLLASVLNGNTHGCLEPGEAVRDLLPNSTAVEWDAADQRAQDWEAEMGRSGDDEEMERGVRSVDHWQQRTSDRLPWPPSSQCLPRPKSTTMSHPTPSFSLATPPFLTGPFNSEFFNGLPLSDSNCDTLPDVSFTELFGPGDSERGLGEAVGGAFGSLTAQALELGGENRALSQEQRRTSTATHFLDSCEEHMPAPPCGDGNGGLEDFDLDTRGDDLLFVALTPHGKFTPGKGRGFKDSPIEAAAESSVSPLDMTWSDVGSPSHSVPGVSSCIPVNTRLFGSTLAAPFLLSECSSARFGEGGSPSNIYLQLHFRLNHPDPNASLAPPPLSSQPPHYWTEGGQGQAGLVRQQGALGTFLTQQAATFFQESATDTAAIARGLLPSGVPWPPQIGPRLVLPDSDHVWDTTFDLSPRLKRRKSNGGNAVPSSPPPSITDPSHRLRLNIGSFGAPSPVARVVTSPPQLLPIPPWVAHAIPVGTSVPLVANPLPVLSATDCGMMAELVEEGCGVRSGALGKRGRTPCAEPQAVAVRARREKVNARMRTLQNLVPGATPMSTEGFLAQTSQYVAALLQEIKDLYLKKSVMGNGQSDYALLSSELPQNLSLRRQGIHIVRLADVAPLMDKGGAMDSLYASLNATKRPGEAGPHVSPPCAYEASDCFRL